METKPTLRDQLASTRVSVSAAEFQAVAALDPRQGASWALWGTTTGDLSIFDGNAAAASRLRKDVVLIGANFGLGGDARVFKTFENFHASSSGGDTKLRKALTGTVLEGVFLTDIVKDYATRDASGLAAEIKTGKLDVDHHIAAGFTAEQEALGIGHDTLYIPIGAKTRELWDLLVGMGVIPAAQRVFHQEYGDGPSFKSKPVLNLSHYSAAVNMDEAVKALLSQRSLK